MSQKQTSQTYGNTTGGQPREASEAPREGGHLRIACDVHTHTLYSRHAYSTIEENVRAAAERGIELLGSTDHYSSLLYSEVRNLERAQEYDLRDFQFFCNYHVWPRTWHGVQLLHGCEADIVDLDGRLFGHDVPVAHAINGVPLAQATTLKRRVFEQCDYVIASVHNRAFSAGEPLARTTAMYVRALEDPKVLILGHTGRAGVPFELDQVLQAAKDLGKLVEINEATLGKHKDAVGRCRTIAERCAELGVMVSTGTDAHISASIGRLDGARALLEEVHFPQELIATRSAQAFLGVLEGAGLGVR